MTLVTVMMRKTMTDRLFETEDVEEETDEPEQTDLETKN